MARRARGSNESGAEATALRLTSAREPDDRRATGWGCGTGLHVRSVRWRCFHCPSCVKVYKSKRGRVYACGGDDLLLYSRANL